VSRKAEHRADFLVFAEPGDQPNAAACTCAIESAAGR
jgi:hypothetical protein